MKFKRLAALSLSVIMTALSTCAVVADEISIKLNGIVQNSKYNSTNMNGYMMFDGKSLSNMFDLKYEWDAKEKALTLTKDDKAVVFKDGNTAYTINGVLTYLPIAAKSGGSDLLLPLRSVCEAFGVNIVWDEASHTISMKSKVETNVLEVADYYKNPNAIKLSYEQALGIVIAKNSSITNLMDNLELLRKQEKDYAENQFNYATGYINPATSQIDTNALTRYLITINSFSSNAYIIKYNEEILKKTSEYLLLSAITTLKTNEMDIQLLDRNIELQKKNVGNLTLKNNVGMASEADLKKAKQDLQSSEANLKLKQLALKSQRLTLNKLLGYSLETSVEIAVTPKFEKLTGLTESEVWGKISGDPSIKIKEENYKIAEYSLSLEKSSEADPETSRVERQNDYNKAGRELTDAKTNMDKNINSAYINLETMLENDASYKIELEKAKDTYNTVLVNFKAGMVTQYEVDQASTAILKIEIDIAKNIYNFNALHFAFSNPYLLA